MTWEDRLPQQINRLGRVATILLVLGLPLPLLAGVGDSSYLISLLLMSAVAGLCALAHPRDERLQFLGLFGIALTLRFFVQLGLYIWAIAGGGPFLNPDASMYLHRSLFLAADNFQHALTPALFFGTYDCAHYYLFAALLRYAGADMYALQMINAGMTALVGPLVYGATRAVLPRYALPVGLVVSISPTLIAYGVNDLLKDPGILFSAWLTLWAVAHLARAERTRARITFALVAIVALSYARMSRFYVAPFFAVAFFAALMLARVSTAAQIRLHMPARRLLAVLALIFVGAELVPMRLGWPPSTVMVADQIVATLNTPAMRVYAKGLFDRNIPDTEPPRTKYKAPRPLNEILHEFKVGSRLPTALAQAEEAERLREEELERQRKLEETKAKGAPAAPTLPQRVIRMAANTFRKLFGPFPWVPPPSWEPKTILMGDYLLFPGMLLWYAVLPLAFGGAALIGWRAVRRIPDPLPLLIAACIVVVFMAQYAVLNLSWRQREFMFPFMVLLAAFALQQGWSLPIVRRGYGAYWALLAVVAVTHLTVRAFIS